MPKIKAILIELEPKQDRNTKPFYRLKLTGLPDYFYAFATDYSLNPTTLQNLKTNPHQFLNQPVLIAYEAVANKDNPGTFKKVKAIALL